MQISIDDESHFALKSNPATMGEVILEITDYVQSRDRAIQEIVLNGKNIPPEELTLMLGKMSIAEVKTLNVRSATIAELVVGALDEIAEVVPELPIACHELAQVLASENPSACFGQFNQFLEIWEVLKERQGQVIDALQLDLSDLVIGDTPIEVHNNKLEEHLARARKCMESSDFPTLSDLLSHDLADMAECEERIIELLKTKL